MKISSNFRYLFLSNIFERKKSPFSERFFASFLTLGQIQFCIKIKQAQQLRQLLQVSFWLLQLRLLKLFL